MGLSEIMRRVFMAITVAAAAPCLAVPAVDQSYTGAENLGANISEGFAYVAQSVTASRSGGLTSADLYFERRGSYTGLWTVQVRATDNSGLPAPLVLASETIASAQVPSLADSGPTFTHVEFSNTPFILAGQRFAFVVSADPPRHGVGMYTGVWAGRTGDNYLLGAPSRSNDNLIFENSGVHDLFFTTYVDSVIPEPTTAVYLLAPMLMFRPRSFLVTAMS